MYSADANQELYLDAEERGKWSWRLDCMGQMFEWDIAMMTMDFCYGYGKEKRRMRGMGSTKLQEL